VVKMQGQRHTCGGYFLSIFWKCAAHSPHGYRREKRKKNDLSVSRSSGVGFYSCQYGRSAPPPST
jgi:hypothetical protein